MLGWELPPFYVGGLGIVCDQLTRSMALHGADIEFVLPFYADYSHITHMKVTSAIDQDSTVLMQSGGTYDSISYQITNLVNGSTEQRNLYQQVEFFAKCVGRMAYYGEYEVIHAHDWLTLRAGIEAKKVTGLPLIAHIHATEYDRSGGGHGNPLVREIEGVGLHMADHVFAISQRVKNILVEHYDIPANKISVAYNTMDVAAEHIDENISTYHVLTQFKKAGYKIVVNAGRMTLQKGIYHLLQAAQKVVSMHPKTIFLFVGGGEQIPELLEQAASLGLSGNVIFTGRVEGIGKEWRDSFKIADVFVLPSVSEPFGLTPLESIAYGTPCIVSKQSGVSELLNNVLKVDYWDTNEMANQIFSVITKPDLQSTMLENSQQERNRLSWHSSSRHIMSTYQRVSQGALA